MDSGGWAAVQSDAASAVYQSRVQPPGAVACVALEFAGEPDRANDGESEQDDKGQA